MKPMLASNPPEWLTLEELTSNPTWAAQRKYDGHRLTVRVDDREATGFNRQGTEVAVPVAADFDNKGFVDTWVFDGEFVNGTYHVFDLVYSDPLGVDQELPLHARLHALESLFGVWNPVNVELVNTVFNNKERYVQSCHDNNLEGVVFKRLSSTYTQGRSTEWVKHKFVETCDVFVTEVNRKGKAQAVSIGLFDDSNKLVDAGGLKIPVELVGKLSVDDVLEVRYLYGTAQNKLYQPIFQAVRVDKVANECYTNQLKRKA